MENISRLPFVEGSDCYNDPDRSEHFIDTLVSYFSAPLGTSVDPTIIERANDNLSFTKHPLAKSLVELVVNQLKDQDYVSRVKGFDAALEQTDDLPVSDRVAARQSFFYRKGDSLERLAMQTNDDEKAQTAYYLQAAESYIKAEFETGEETKFISDWWVRVYNCLDGAQFYAAARGLVRKIFGEEINIEFISLGDVGNRVLMEALKKTCSHGCRWHTSCEHCRST